MSDSHLSQEAEEALERRAAAAKAKLDAWDEAHSLRGKFDHGMLNVSLRARNGKRGIDGLARSRAALQEAVENAEHKLARARAVPRVAAEKAAAEARHAEVDLRSMYGGKKQVLWLLNGEWMDVIRWNKKSVTVRMAGESDTIPHTQVGGVK